MKLSNKTSWYVFKERQLSVLWESSLGSMWHCLCCTLWCVEETWIQSMAFSSTNTTPPYESKQRTHFLLMSKASRLRILSGVWEAIYRLWGLSHVSPGRGGFWRSKGLAPIQTLSLIYVRPLIFLCLKCVHFKTEQ